jgi:ectoine hydroxylase-related dioxygenase (phytanoyl-CoA dioxygenase family)
MLEPDGTGYTSLITCLIAGTEVTAENGGTLVARGSHKWDRERYPLVSETVPVEMDKGSAFIFLGSTFHGRLSLQRSQFQER